jgi:predicted nucleic acid-binding protein
VIYLDSSVALAHLLAEDRRPAASLWNESLVSSRLLEYEVWNRIHFRQLAKTHADAARALIGRVYLIELDREVIVRAVDPFPLHVRTLDALHLATAQFLRARGQELSLATYDTRLQTAARALHIPLYALAA